MVLGIVSIVTCLGFITGIPAIILGAQGQKWAAQGRATNKSMATAGLIMGVIGTVLAGAMWYVASVFPYYF
ncbi:MAG: DUF4190 domain-containing protein [Propionibacteriaceae bacterium]|nr:DUF4190 domain-containing protein [Propionibacteriaceae bacterium]